MRLTAFFTTALVLGVIAEAGAQTTPSPPGWDTAIVTGFYFGRPADISGAQHHDNWFQTGQVGITAGRYWTEHLKTEAEVSLTGEGRRHATQFVTVPGPRNPMPVGVEQRIRTRAIAGTVTWQFLENAWVHPYVLAGAALEFDRTRTDVWNQFLRPGDAETTKHVRGIVGAGAKMYFTPRGFFRAETRAGIGDKGSHLSFRAGFGIDF